MADPGVGAPPDDAPAAARVLIIGGYGNFGGYIARALASDPRVRLLIGGRSQARADAFAAGLGAPNPAEGHAIDIDADLGVALTWIAPDIVVHTTGPFQHQDHRVARACIDHGCHYLDLADAREFVCSIGDLNAAARAQGVLVVSGASSVPCLTAAVIDRYRPDFARLDLIDYGISAAQQTNRGLATTAAVLSYVGRRFTRLKNGGMRPVHGWQDTRVVRYPGLGYRLLGDCDIPDLELFPRRYPGVRDIRFGAGHELKILHVGTWALGWLVRLGLVRSLGAHAGRLLRLAFLFDRFGSGRSAFHMFLSGAGRDGEPKRVRFFMMARSGHGPYIPCMPAILLVRKLARRAIDIRGAMPCLDLIELDEYLAALDGLDITVQVETPDA
jgi:hypothetical protein